MPPADTIRRQSLFRAAPDPAPPLRDRSLRRSSTAAVPLRSNPPVPSADEVCRGMFVARVWLALLALENHAVGAPLVEGRQLVGVALDREPHLPECEHRIAKGAGEFGRLGSRLRLDGCP